MKEEKSGLAMQKDLDHCLDKLILNLLAAKYRTILAQM